MINKINAASYNINYGQNSTRKQLKVKHARAKITKDKLSKNQPSNKKVKALGLTTLSGVVGIGLSLLCFKKQYGKTVNYMNEMLEATIKRLGYVPNEIQNKLLNIKSNTNLLYDIAAKDELTQLFNRKILNSDLSKFINEAKQSGRNLSLAFIDIDNFKGVNDLLGHCVGDKFLKEFGKMLNNLGENYPKQVTSYRFGGEEFVILIKEGKVDKKEILENLMENFKQNKVIQENKKAFILEGFKKLKENNANTLVQKWLDDINFDNGKFSISIGLSNLKQLPKEQQTAEFLKETADAACYVAKTNSRKYNSIVE